MRKHSYRGILSSIVADDPKPTWVPLGPLGDFVDLPIDDKPLVVPMAVSLNLLPGVNAATLPAARLLQLYQLASTIHLHTGSHPVSGLDPPGH